MKKLGFKIVFLNDGGFQIILPNYNLLNALVFFSNQFDKQSALFQRPTKEALLRKVVYNLFETGYLDRQRSIIDIGCWLADNTLPWSIILSDDAVVHAIDPSEANLNFGQRIAKMNNISNINWVEAVCSDRSNTPLTFVGNINHAKFSESSDSSTIIMSTTLDDIIDATQHKDISLIHIDVEGFEEKVLRGANGIIDRCRPVIIFEQHISREKFTNIAEFLCSKDYKVFMINEVLTDCSLDCRNFIAFDNTAKLPDTLNVHHHLGRDQGIFYASMDEALVPVHR